MTTPSTPRRAGPYTGTGSLVSYPFTFKVFAKEDLVVTVADAAGTESRLLLDSGYLVTLNPDQETSPGGSVQHAVGGVATPLPAGYKLAVTGEGLDFAQDADFPAGGNFNPLVAENALDRLVMLMQVLRDAVGRALQLGVTTDSTTDVRLPAPVADKLLGWDSTGKGLRNVDIQTLATIIAFAAWQSQTFSGNGVSKIFTLSSDPGNIANLDIAVDGVSKRPLLDYTLSGTELTFTTAPASGSDNILARWGQALPQGTTALETYLLDTSNTSHGSAMVATKRTAAGAAAKLLSAWLDEDSYHPVRDFGAAGDGTTDDTGPVQNAINAAILTGRALNLSGRWYKCGALTVTGRLHAFGSGKFSCGIISTVTGANDAVTITPQVGSGNTGYKLHDFGIKPTAAGNGRYGLRVYLQAGAYFSNSEFDALWIDDFGSYGLRLDNDVANVDGFFVLTIRRCWLHNGLNGSKVGDSISICENTITGSRLTTPGVLMSGLSGARQVVLRENNITTKAGAVALIGMEQPKLRDNQIEHPAYLGNYNGPYAAQVYFSNVVLAEIQGNTVGTGAATVGVTGADYALLFEGTSYGNKIGGNDIAKGEVYHVGFGPSATNNTLRTDNTYDTTLAVLNDGVNNAGVEADLTLVNSWVAYAADTSGKVKRSEDGTVVVRGAVANGTITSGTTITTLPVGFRPARQKRFQVTNFNGTVFSSATLLVGTDGTVKVMAAAANTLLHLDGIVFNLD